LEKQEKRVIKHNLLLSSRDKVNMGEAWEAGDTIGNHCEPEETKRFLLTRKPE
jgi:hypothetical protein